MSKQAKPIDPTKLGEAAVFEGLPVTEVAVEIPNVSGGLNRAMPIEPVVVHKGDVFYVVARVEADKFRHEPVDKEDEVSPWRRVQIAPASVVGVATGDLVDACAAFLDAQALAIDLYEMELEGAAARAKQAEKDAANGQQTIDDTGVGTETITVDDAKPKADEVAAKRDEKVKSTAATKSAGRQANPISKSEQANRGRGAKKATSAKKAPAKKSTARKPRTH